MHRCGFLSDQNNSTRTSLTTLHCPFSTGTFGRADLCFHFWSRVVHDACMDRLRNGARARPPCLRAGCGDLSPARCWSEKLCIYRNAITVCSCVWDASSPVKEECPVGSRRVTEHVVLFGVNPGYCKWRAGHTVDSTAVWKEPPCAGRWAASDRGLSWGWGGTQPRSS